MNWSILFVFIIICIVLLIICYILHDKVEAQVKTDKPVEDKKTGQALHELSYQTIRGYDGYPVRKQEV